MNLFDFTVHSQSTARRLLSSFHCIIWKYFQKLWYFVADLVGGDVSGSTNDLAVASFSISRLWRRELIVWSVFPLKIIDIALLPADSISSCDRLLGVKTKATSCKCYFEISFLNTVAFFTPYIEEVA